MRPQKFMIKVIDSVDKLHTIDHAYEILVRVGLSLFAIDPEIYMLHTKIFKHVTKLGYMGIPNECLLSPGLCDAMKKNKEVIYHLIINTIFSNPITIFYCFR